MVGLSKSSLTAMDVNLDEVVVRDNTSANHDEVWVGNHLAVMTYERAPGRITFIHTLVPSALAGHGIADKMAHIVPEEARAAGLAAIPRCPYVVQRHPEYRDLVPADEWALVGLLAVPAVLHDRRYVPHPGSRRSRR